MPIKIRNYVSSDALAIANIYNEAVLKGGITMDREPYSAKQIANLVAKFGRREAILVADKDHAVVGWGIVKKYSDRTGYRLACETSIYLTRSETKKGYGYRLQTALLEQVAAWDYHHVVAKILAANQGSIKFHQKFGFKIVGIQKEIGFYEGQWHDVAIMQLIVDAAKLSPE